MERSENLLKSLLDREIAGADEPAAPVTNAFVAASAAMWTVWSAGEQAATHSGRTKPVRRPYTRSGKMKGP
jgi:hypothetical protein